LNLKSKTSSFCMRGCILV